jgi:hypothetical protein
MNLWLRATFGNFGPWRLQSGAVRVTSTEQKPKPEPNKRRSSSCRPLPPTRFSKRPLPEVAPNVAPNVAPQRRPPQRRHYEGRAPGRPRGSPSCARSSTPFSHRSATLRPATPAPSRLGHADRVSRAGPLGRRALRAQLIVAQLIVAQLIVAQPSVAQLSVAQRPGQPRLFCRSSSLVLAARSLSREPFRSERDGSLGAQRTMPLAVRRPPRRLPVWTPRRTTRWGPTRAAPS